MPRDDEDRPTLTTARQQLSLTGSYAPLLYLSLKRLVQDIDERNEVLERFFGSPPPAWDNLEEARALIAKVEARA